MRGLLGHVGGESGRKAPDVGDLHTKPGLGSPS